MGHSDIILHKVTMVNVLANSCLFFYTSSRHNENLKCIWSHVSGQVVNVSQMLTLF